MAKFLINEGYDDEKTVEANNWRENGSFVMFLSPAGEQVYSIPTKNVYRVEIVKE